MKRIALALIAIPALLTACQSGGGRDTLAQLRNLKVDIKEESVQGGLDKAMDSYQRFLDETPESRLTPTAMRRLADLKLEKEYGFQSPTLATAARPASPVLPAPERAESPKVAAAQPAPAPQAGKVESDDDFEKRATQTSMAPAKGGQQVAGADELERAGARDAIAIYKKLLDKFPNYPGNDQVLYQMSRAYEELGQTEDAMVVMSRLVKEYPQSRYNDEVRFRRAEFYFTRKKYIEGEDAYKSIVATGPKSPFYELALYKLGWSFYKQELYDEALHRFIALLDHKVSRGYDFAQTKDDQERKRVDDTFRVISQSFSYLHGADSVVEYFDTHGKRSYEDLVYSNLGEFYFDKRRYTDAAAAYNSFAKRNPFHRVTPQFHMRVIDIEMAGGFPSIVIEAKKQFAINYGLKAEYWKHFDPKARPEVLGWLKTNVTDLAHHYHSLYQDPEHAKEKRENFQEAQHWYEEFLFSFPKDGESPAINYQLAELLLENHSFAKAALEYEKTAYSYPNHAKSSAAGYAAIYAYRERLKEAPAEEKEKVKRETVRSSLRFADTFPKHEKAPIVLGAAADDLYEMKDYKQSLAAASKLIQIFPAADQETRKSAWTVVGHSCYELQQYAQAESAYGKVLTLLPADDKVRGGFVDNLAASIYKQGEQALALKNYRAAADHFLRVGKLAGTSKIRPNAEFDAAAALIQLKDWKMAATVLTGFRELFPGHQLQPEVTRKIAYVYKENGQLALAAGEYERVETEFKDEEVRRGALMLAADLHQQAGNKKKALAVYRRFVRYFPEPVEVNVEMRNKVVEIVKAENDQEAYLSELKEMVAVEAAAGQRRTPRTRFLAGKAALVLAEKKYERFTEVRLVKPFEENLRKKKELMKAATGAFGSLVDYEVGEVTAAATFYLAEIYANFSKSLTESERPTDLDAQEKQEFDLAIEEQAYPFEEKAIQIHQKNLDLIGRGIYNPWIDKSLNRLAKFMPARYDKPEVAAEVVPSLDSYAFEVERPAPPKPVPAPAPAAQAAKPAATASATPSTTSTPSTSSTPAKAAAEQQATTQAKTTAVPRAKAPAVVPQPTGGNEHGTDAKR